MVFFENCKYIVFSGSGTLGYSFEGAIQCMEDILSPASFKRIEGVAGTSGGAICALMFALSLSREDRAKVMEWLTDTRRLVPCPDITLMMNKFGIENGRAFRQIIREIVALGGLSEKTTLMDMERLLRLKIVFVATNLNRGGVVHLSAETAPDMLVSDAVFASCCIPVVFAPFRHNESLYCDGALTEYVPDVFPPDQTLALEIPVDEGGSPSINSWGMFLGSMMHVNFELQKKFRVSIPNTIRVWDRTLEGLPCNILDGGVDEQTVRIMQHAGYISCVAHLFPSLCAIVGRVVTLLSETQITLDSTTTTCPMSEDENGFDEDG